MAENPAFTAVAVLLFSAAATWQWPVQNAAAAPAAPRARPFRMGFTAFPHDITAEPANQTRQFVRTNADLIAHHISKPYAMVETNDNAERIEFPKSKLVLNG